MKGQPKSINRLQARDLEKKLMPAIKQLSKHMHGTHNKVPVKNFHGYVIPAGEMDGASGLHWQIQVKAVCTKKEYIKTNEIKPIIRKWAIFFRLRLFASALVENIFKVK